MVLFLLAAGRTHTRSAACPDSTPRAWAFAAAQLGSGCVLDGTPLRSKEIAAAVHLNGADAEETCGTMAVFMGGHLCGLAVGARPWYPGLRGVVPDSGKHAFQVQCCDISDERGAPLRHHRMTVRFARATGEPVLALHSHLPRGLSWDQGRAVPYDFMVQGLTIFTGVTDADARGPGDTPARSAGTPRGHEALSVYACLVVTFLGVCLAFTYCAYRERVELVLPVSYTSSGKFCKL